MEKGVPYVPVHRGVFLSSRSRYLFDLLSSDDNGGPPRGASAAQHGARDVQRDVVPLVRALWFAKVTILKEFIEKDKSEVSA
jgi:hypothetical protein